MVRTTSSPQTGSSDPMAQPPNCQECVFGDRKHVKHFSFHINAVLVTGPTFLFGVLHQFFAGRIITPFVKLATLLAVERGALE